MRSALGALVVLTACNRAPSSIDVDQAAATTQGIDVTVTFEDKDHDIVVPKSGDVTLAVQDLVPNARAVDDDIHKKETCKVVVPVASGVVDASKKVKFHGAATCPPLTPNLTRTILVRLGDIAYGGKNIQTAPRPAAGPAPPAVDPKVTMKKAIAAFPAPNAPDKACDNTRVGSFFREDRDKLQQGEFHLWDDAAHALGVPGARPLCPSVMNDFAQQLPKLGRITMIYRPETCVQPHADAATKTFTPGRTSGVVGIVDVTDGTVLCWGRISAATDPSISVFKEATDPNDTIVRSFTHSLHDAADAESHRLSKFLGLPNGTPDPPL